MAEGDRKAALNEAKILKKMKHPNIVSAHDVYKTKSGRLHIVMEYVDGGDLNKIIKKRKDMLKNCEPDAYFQEEEIFDIFCQICLALVTIHEKKIIHRDVKSHNIFMTKDMVVKVGDFGIAKCLQSTKSRANTMVGTPYYFSPEMCMGHQYDTKSDVWSLGVLLFEMCFLSYPFKGKNISQLINNITTGKWEDYPQIYSRHISNILKGLLQKDPKKRPSL